MSKIYVSVKKISKEQDAQFFLYSYIIYIIIL